MKEWFQEKITDAKVLDISIEVYKKKFKSLIGYQFLFTIILFVLMMVGALLIIPLLVNMQVGGILGFVIFMFIVVILMGTITFLSEAGIFHITYSFIRGEDITASEAVGKAFSSFKHIIRVVTALALCILPIIILLGLGGVTMSTVTALQKNMESGSVYFTLGYTLFFSLISAVVGSYLFYSLHIAIFEKEKGLPSIKKSIGFTKGEVLKNAFRVFSISMFQWGVNLSIYASVGIIAGLLSFALGRVQGGTSIVSQMMLYGTIARPIINFVLGIILSPISSIIWTVYYINMRYKKEGFKITNMLNRLQENVSEEIHENLGEL